MLQLEKLDYYKSLNKEDKCILKLAAYLHDIGKGPKSKWKSGKQSAYPDHPVDAIPMLERILVEDFEELNDDEVEQICMYVVYHDLIGEIIGKKRNIAQLFSLLETEKQFDMLSTLNFADVSAIRYDWKMEYKFGLPRIKKSLMEHISKT